MNVTAANESMTELRKSLLAVETARSAANAMLRAASKAAPETAAQMARMVEGQVKQVVEQLKAAAATADALVKLLQTTAPAPEPTKAAAKN